MTNTYVRDCKSQGKRAKFSDQWYDKKAEYDKNNKTFQHSMNVIIAGIILCILGVAGLFFAYKEHFQKSVASVISGAILIIIGGSLALTAGTKDEPTPTETDFLGCVDK